MSFRLMKFVPALACALWAVTAMPASAQFFDDFNGTQLDYSRWFIAEKQWGGDNNNGVVHNNVIVSNGVLHLTGHGNLYTGSVKGAGGAAGQQVGAAIATTNYFASGRYEVRLKLPPQVGGTSAIWPFHYEEAYQGDAIYPVLAQVGGLTVSNLTWIGLTSIQATNLVADLTGTNGSRLPYLYFPTNGVYRTTANFRKITDASQMVLTNDFNLRTQIFVELANAASLNQVGGGYIRNEEIDIETPTALMGGNAVSYANARFNTWVGQNTAEYTPFYDNLGYVFNDGQYHTYRFDWHTDNPNIMAQRVEFYVDDVCYQTNYTHIPTIGGRFWVGYWFSSWSGTPDFDTQELDVDWVRITPFHENGDQSVAETYPNDGWWAPSTTGSAAPAITSVSPNTGTAGGGTVIIISGTNFFTGATVQFGTATPIAATFTSNQLQLVVTTPAHAAGAVSLVVSNVNRQVATTAFTFTPQGATPTTTTLTRHSGGATSTYGDALTFDVGVSPGAATGTVALSENGANLGSATLSSGGCSITPAYNALLAGVHPNIVATYLGDTTYAASTSAALSAQTVQPLTLTIDGATANNKLYDGTTAAIITGTLTGVLSGDTVSFNGTGIFQNTGPGTNIAVTAAITLGGISASNYAVIQPNGLTATITASPGIPWIRNSSGGVWSDPANWSGGIVATDKDQTADFGELDPGAPITVHLDTPLTIGNLIFGDTGTDSASAWTLDNNSTAANFLTLAGTAPPVITVNDPLTLGETVTISAVIAGNNGLVKAGRGSLSLSAVNTFTGGVTVANGTLILANSAGDANAVDIYTLGSPGGGSASLFCGNSGIGNPIMLAGGAVGTLMIGNNLAGSHPAFTGAINLNGQNLTVIANTGGSGNTFLSGGVTGGGNLTFTNASGSTSTLLVNAPGLNNSGTVTLAGASTGGKFNLTGTLGTNITALIYASSSTPVAGSPAPSINVNSHGTAITSGSTLNLPSTGGITIGSTGTNLTLNANSTGSIVIASVGANFSGSIINSGTGTGAAVITAALTSPALGIVQNSATSPLILSGANTYGGSTVISAGKLVLTNSAAISSSTNISLAAGSVLDVSALTSTTFTVGSSAILRASGTGMTAGTAAAIFGRSGGAINLGSSPLILTFDGSHPALYISQGTLSLNNNAFTVNSPSPLSAGTYTIVQQAAGNISGTGNFAVTGTAIASGASGMISISGGNVNLVVTGSGQPSPPAKLMRMTQSGSSLNLIWAGGTNQTCLLLTSTNISQSVSAWAVMATNTVGTGGLSTNVIPIDPSQPRRFYLLAVPN